MKAVTYSKFGPPEVLHMTEVDRPVPKENEVLIRVHAVTVNAVECNMRGFSYVPPGLGLLARMMLGFSKPKKNILGSSLSGRVEAVGRNVTSFKPGDRVFGAGVEMGGYAEYACRPENGALTTIPENISYEEAAAVPYGALTAFYFLKNRGNVKSGQKVLVNGASGGVGVYAVQIAKYFGAGVTGVCSTANSELVKSIGADDVIDYSKEDILKSGKKWDIILDVVVGKTSFSRFRRLLNPKGLYLAVAGGLPDMLQMLRTKVTGGRKVIFGGGAECDRKDNLEFLRRMMEEGSLRPVIDRIFAFDEIVEAHRYVESGQKKGNIAVRIP